MGMGVGLILPQATSMIVELYEAEKREKLLGWSQGLANIGSMIGSIIGGSLALINWKYNFFGFGVAFVILSWSSLVFQIFHRTRLKQQGKPSEMPKRFFHLYFYVSCTSSIPGNSYNMAIFVNSEPWGNPSSLV